MFMSDIFVEWYFWWSDLEVSVKIIDVMFVFVIGYYCQ